MTKIDVLTCHDTSEWMRVLSRCGFHDFYHLPQYHVLAEESGDGHAHLFHYSEGEHTIALPLLLRPLEDALVGLNGSGPLAREWVDATSVYGYAGPLCSAAEIPEGVIRNFQAALRQRLDDLRVVSVFSRLHPLFARQHQLLTGMGEYAVLAPTVSIDLTLPVDVQRSQIRRSHREGANRLRRLGVVCVEDRTGAALDDFIRIYHETMRRVGALESFFFPPEYFEQLQQALGDRLHCFVCRFEGQVICGGLFVDCHGIVQYHLGATRDDALKLAPMKLLMDEVRVWATARGDRVLHLGGGATPHPEDSLLYFKKGFSDRLHDFSVWRWIVVPDAYQQLCRQKSQWNERHNVRAGVPHYFPAYRCPVVPSMPESMTAELATAEPAAL